MLKNYIWIVITYAACYFSGYIPRHFPEVLTFVPASQRSAIWTVVTFGIAFIIIVLLLLPERKLDYRHRLSFRKSLSWAIAGPFLLFFTQIIINIIIINLFHINPKSENTTTIINITRNSLYLILFINIIGPILEEIIFRKIIFGIIYRKTNFIIAGLISSLIFAFAHRDYLYLVPVYVAIGLVLCFLYKKTGRIWVSMFAHASMNAVVTLSLLVKKPEIPQHALSFLYHSQYFFIPH
ncbi:CPBP family intramembrane glutamic endopeptidase [Terrilactibacillus laevilacticus]|uniref:CPBP family intramembrane glutamic endopeptidase n=1 Tax=Terrilactibacillus laevilacticus TaxID=1380157 RepID=UPI0015EF0668|nr:CPBP family intramembrane glutamic endopeptidase [Terrilactibacillus laevilacticus]